jgi:sensor domain CHASE-containing protein
MSGDGIARAPAAVLVLFAATAWAADTAPKVDQQTFREKVDDVRKAIQTERADTPSTSAPVSDVVDICKINPKLPQCRKP